MFKNEILILKSQFFRAFNDAVFGLDPNQQKEIGLQNFLSIYDAVYCDLIEYIEQKKSATGIEHISAAGKMKMLYQQHEGFRQTVMMEMFKAVQYLTGDTTFYNKENIEYKFENIEKVIAFETDVQILIQLNDRFGFEKDIYFTQIAEDKRKFEQYRHIFHTLEAYQFTNGKILSFVDNKKAQIESLYEVLVHLNLVKKHKENFMTFLVQEYNITITKIISYDKYSNYVHDERVSLFTKEFEELTSKK